VDQKEKIIRSMSEMVGHETSIGVMNASYGQNTHTKFEFDIMAIVDPKKAQALATALGIGQLTSHVVFKGKVFLEGYPHVVQSNRLDV